ncbi:hypothetical protein EJ03DRAFT_7142 [Teratosphaeria nubilosa]|uniref:Uncharacterized protein n=1 Tax=Teratosphaeria nubilosa TaxID=161662 RepID=A0A6G1LP87_9PEZI|nr:hypothetical protein EJ03DRAFT_7142 [Teratosphaeria nubilosa]
MKAWLDLQWRFPASALARPHLRVQFEFEAFGAESIDWACRWSSRQLILRDTTRRPGVQHLAILAAAKDFGRSCSTSRRGFWGGLSLLRLRDDTPLPYKTPDATTFFLVHLFCRNQGLAGVRMYCNSGFLSKTHSRLGVSVGAPHCRYFSVLSHPDMCSTT